MSALEHAMKLILCSCVLLVFINRICKHYYVFKNSINSSTSDKDIHNLPNKYGEKACCNLDLTLPNVELYLHKLQFQVPKSIIFSYQERETQTHTPTNTHLHEYSIIFNTIMN